MAATTQEEILSGILPRVSIEKINLTNESNNLRVNVELIIKEVLDNNFFGSWFDDINIKNYIIIDVVQSIDPKITEALSFSNDMIRICNLSRGKKLRTDDIRTKALSYITAETSIKKLVDNLDSFTKVNTISLNEDSNRNSNIKNYPSYTNSDGEKVYEISYKTNFLLRNTLQPEHLAYFAVCSIDLPRLCADFNIDYDIIESFEENGKVVSEIVIQDSKIAGYSYIFIDANGVAWSGPVHQNEIGEWRSGDDETPDSITLSRIFVSNTKIQDFRNFAELERMFLDFNQQYTNGTPIRDSFNLENTLNKITKIQSVDYKPKGKNAEFTDIFSSMDSDGNVKFLFGIDFINVLKSYSKFSKLYETNTVDEFNFKTESNSRTKILDLKLYRRRIKNNISANSFIAKLNLEKLNENEPDELIFQTKDENSESSRNFIDLNNEKGSIREIDNLFITNDSDFMRYFTGVDKSFKNLNDGIYQYYLEFEIEDGSFQVIQEQISNLNIAKQDLINYYNKVSTPTMRKHLLESREPHIQSPSLNSNSSIVTDYGYDIVLNKLSNQAADRLIREYAEKQSEAPWVNCVAIFITALKIFSSSVQTTEDIDKINNFLSTILQPRNTSPSIIAKIAELIDYFISSLCNTFDVDLTDPADSSKISISSSKTNRSFKVIKFFDDISDTNFLKTYNIDYLSVSVDEANNYDGLKILDTNKLTQRISNEMLKFFSGEDLTINFSGEAENASQNIKYSFFTPTRLDFDKQSVVFSGIQNNDITTQTRTSENFYNTTNQYEKALSMYADILNFKLDVSGKNRRRIFKDRNRNINENEKVSKKIRDVFSDFSNLTINSFNLNTSNANSLELQNNNIRTGFSEIRTNLSPLSTNSLNYLMSSLSSGAVRSKQSYNQSYTSVSSHGLGNIISNSENDYIKNLVNYARSPLFSVRTLTPEVLKNIPNQIRAIMLKPQQLSSNIVNNLDYTGDFSTYIKNKTINYFNFEMIAEVQYLDGFERISGTDNLNLNEPIWRRLTADFINSVTNERQILCKLKSFRNDNLKINSSPDLEKRYYDKYFIIKRIPVEAPPDTINSSITGGDILEKFRDSLLKDFPGIRIKETENINPSLAGLFSGIEIIKTDNSGRKEVISIKDIKDIVARDINRNVKTTTGKVTTPVSAVAAAQALSLSIQQANISNNYRSSNHVPNRNIGSSQNRNVGRSRGRGIAERVGQNSMPSRDQTASSSGSPSMPSTRRRNE